MVLSVGALPRKRPDRLGLTTVRASWWRLDEHDPNAWSWAGFPLPRNRFDVPRARVRYAALTERGAFREHFAESGRFITGRHAGLRVIRLTGNLHVVDLRNEATLDQLGLDAEISTGRAARVLDTCRALAERLLDWYGTDLHGVAYTSRTTPQTSANLAFFAHAPLRASSLGGIGDRTDLLTQLVLDDGFRIDLPGWQ